MSVYVIEYCVCLLGRVCFHLTVPLASLYSWEHQTRPTCQKSVFSSLASALHLTFNLIHKHLTIHLKPHHPTPALSGVLFWFANERLVKKSIYFSPLFYVFSPFRTSFLSVGNLLFVVWGSVGVIMSKNGPWLHEGNSAEWVSGWARNFKRDKMSKNTIVKSTWIKNKGEKYALQKCL